MASEIIIKFKMETVDYTMDIERPDFAEFIHKVVSEHLQVSRENITIDTGVEDFDKEDFKDIICSVHEEFAEEINTFYGNVKKEIKTYYSDDELGDKIIEIIKERDGGEKGE